MGCVGVARRRTDVEKDEAEVARALHLSFDMHPSPR